MTIKLGSNLDKVLTIIYKKLCIEDYDEVLVISGDEGTGKSNLLLHILEWWKLRERILTKEDLKDYFDTKGILKIKFSEFHQLLNNKEKNKIKPDDVKNHVGMDAKEFSVLLRDAKKYDILLNDEAADISSRSAISKTNKMFMIVYQLIRGENLFTILVIPSIYDLDPFFRKRRVRHLINTDKRGVYSFWTKKKLRKMIEYNESRKYRTVTNPSYYGSVGKYIGVYRETYIQMKADKMAKVRQMIADKLNEDDDFTETEKTIVKNKEDVIIAEAEAMQKAYEAVLKERELRIGVDTL